MVKPGGKRKKTHKVCKKIRNFYDIGQKFKKVGGIINNNFPEIGEKCTVYRNFESMTKKGRQKF